MPVDALSEITCGAKFYGADLHIHSLGASFDVTDVAATAENIVATASSENLSLHMELIDNNKANATTVALAAKS